MARPLLDTDYPSWDSLTNAAEVRPVFFVSMDFGSSSFDEMTSFEIDGSFWSANGLVQNFTLPRESIKFEEKSTFDITVSGLDATLLAQCLAARQLPGFFVGGDIVFASIDIWFLNADWSIHSEYSYNVAAGLLEGCEVLHSEEGTVCKLTFQQSDDFLWDRPVEGRYTDAFQRSWYSTEQAPLFQSYSADKGFEFVEKLQDWQLFWAKPQGHKKGHKHQRPKKPRQQGTRK